MAHGAEDCRLDRIASAERLGLQGLATETLPVECDGEQRGESGQEAGCDLAIGLAVGEDPGNASVSRAKLVGDLGRLGAPDRVELDPRALDAESTRDRFADRAKLVLDALTLEQGAATSVRSADSRARLSASAGAGGRALPAR